MRAHDLTLPVAKASWYKFDMKWTPLKSRLLKAYFPECRFFGDHRFSFALRKDGRIVCFYIDYPLKRPFETAPDLEPIVFEDFLKEAGMKVTDAKIAEDVGKMSAIIARSGEIPAAEIEASSEYRVKQIERGWIVYTPDTLAGNDTFVTADYEITLKGEGMVDRIKVVQPYDFGGPEGVPSEFYEPSLNRGGEAEK